MAKFGSCISIEWSSKVFAVKLNSSAVAKILTQIRQIYRVVNGRYFCYVLGLVTEIQVWHESYCNDTQTYGLFGFLLSRIHAQYRYCQTVG